MKVLKTYKQNTIRPNFYRQNKRITLKLIENAQLKQNLDNLKKQKTLAKLAQCKQIQTNLAEL